MCASCADSDREDFLQAGARDELDVRPLAAMEQAIPDLPPSPDAAESAALHAAGEAADTVAAARVRRGAPGQLQTPPAMRTPSEQAGQPRPQQPPPPYLTVPPLPLLIAVLGCVCPPTP